MYSNCYRLQHEFLTSLSFLRLSKVNSDRYAWAEKDAKQKAASFLSLCETDNFPATKLANELLIDSPAPVLVKEEIVIKEGVVSKAEWKAALATKVGVDNVEKVTNRIAKQIREENEGKIIWDLKYIS